MTAPDMVERTRPEPRDAGQIATELHTLLAKAGVEPPYVMVGHSVGGIYIRVYNSQYAAEVVGMVLVDATHPDNWNARVNLSKHFR